MAALEALADLSSDNKSSDKHLLCTENVNVSDNIFDSCVDHHSDNVVYESVLNQPNNLSESQSNSILVENVELDSRKEQKYNVHRRKSQQTTARLLSKIHKCKEAIKYEQRLRDEYVNEYLSVSVGGPKQKVKSLFEKKNQRSSHQMSFLQRKLENYQTRLKAFEKEEKANDSNAITSTTYRDSTAADSSSSGVSNLTSANGLKSGFSTLTQGLSAVVENVKEGIHEAADTVMSKPREFAHLFRHRFGSADNINTLVQRRESGISCQRCVSPTLSTSVSHSTTQSPFAADCTVTFSTSRPAGTSSTLPPGIPSSVCVSAGEPKAAVNTPSSSLSVHITDASVSSSHSSVDTRSTSIRKGRKKQEVSRTVFNTSGIDYSLDRDEVSDDEEIRCCRCEQMSEDLSAIRTTLQQEMASITTQLHSRRSDMDRIDVLLNELGELYRSTSEGQRQTMVEMEERLLYRNEERMGDMHELLDTCVTRLARIEQQLAGDDGLYEECSIRRDLMLGRSAWRPGTSLGIRVLLVRVLNVGLMVFELFLLLAAAIWRLVFPLVRLRRLVLFLFLLNALIFLLYCVVRTQNTDSQLTGTISNISYL